MDLVFANAKSQSSRFREPFLPRVSKLAFQKQSKQVRSLDDGRADYDDTSEQVMTLI